MSTTLDQSTTPTPTSTSTSTTLSAIQTQLPQLQQQQPTQSSLADQQPPPSPSSTNPIYAPLPTRRALSQLLREWQQSFTTQQQQQQPAPQKDTLPSVPESPKAEFVPPTTPGPVRTPSRILVSPSSSYPGSSSPHLTMTTPTHTRRSSITNFIPADSLLMSPIPRARNPGGFRPTSSGSNVDEEMPFGEVVGLVGGWEEKMRSPTAWAVVNTSGPAVHSAGGVEENEKGRRSSSVDIGVNA